MQCSAPVFRRDPVGAVTPCGVCIACRCNKASEWSVRGSHERMMCDSACSITLTYDPDHVPPLGLNPVHLRNFWKLLRRQLDYRKIPGAKFKYLACGEYGENDDGSKKFSHPHYHAVLFGLDFSDKYFWRKGKLGHKLFRSDFLEEIWKFGHCEVGGAEQEMIDYVARYTLKKVYGDNEMATDHYGFSVFHSSGDLFPLQRVREFLRSSNGIGLKFLENFWDDIFSYDELVLYGKRRAIPTYYMNKLRDKSESFYQQIKASRLENVGFKPYYSARSSGLIKSLEDLRICNEARMGLYS